MIYRNITPKILEALQDTPVIFLNGARQTGKSTLAQWLAKEKYPAKYFTFDDVTTFVAAKESPVDFIKNLQTPAIIDEVQRVPEVFIAIKYEIDQDRQPGKFLLTGSANVLLFPKISESLAGRLEIITLWPLSRGEISGSREGFVDFLFSNKEFEVSDQIETTEQAFEQILLGGYPEVLTRAKETRRQTWFNSYITTILQRDVRDIAHIQGLTELPKLLSLLAARATSLLNFAEISRSSAIQQTSLKRYITLLETTFLIQRLCAWSPNLGKRLVKAPKMVMNDSGLMSYLLGLEKNRLLENRHLMGPLFENFVIMEIFKQIGWSTLQPRIFHFRTQSGLEVDIVLEDRAGKVVGIDVKSAASVSAGDFKGLRFLSESLRNKFHRGIVLYRGEKILPFGKNLFAVPLPALWQTVMPT